MRFPRMTFNAKPDDSSDTDKVAADIAAAAASVVAKEAPKEDDTELDDKAKLFVRMVTDSVRSAVAELLNPSKPPEVLPDDEEEVEEAGKKVRRKRKPSAAPAKPRKRSFLDNLL